MYCHNDGTLYNNMVNENPLNVYYAAIMLLLL